MWVMAAGSVLAIIFEKSVTISGLFVNVTLIIILLWREPGILLRYFIDATILERSISMEKSAILPVLTLSISARKSFKVVRILAIFIQRTLVVNKILAVLICLRLLRIILVFLITLRNSELLLLSVTVRKFAVGTVFTFVEWTRELF